MIKSLFINEIIKTISKKRTYIAFILLGFLIPLIVMAIGSGADYLEQKIYGQLKDSFIVFGSLTNGFLSTYLIIGVLTGQMPFLTTIVPAEIVSGEYARGTFRMYLSRPVTRSSVLFSKLLVVLVYTTLIMFFFIFYTLVVSCTLIGIGDLAVFHKGFLLLSDGDILWRFFLVFMISTSVMITVSNLCFMLSTFCKNSVTPIIITISTVFIGSIISFIPLEIFEFVNPFLFTGYIDLFLVAFHDPIPWELVLKSTIVCLTWSVSFIIVSFYHFSNKEILE